MAETPKYAAPPGPGYTGVVVLADGSVFWGHGLGAEGDTVGEVCFNTSMTGYQEILTDPSYAGQIISFTFPHIGNVGTNPEDIETQGIAARGLILRAPITSPSNFRSATHLSDWLKLRALVGISGIDTRAMTRRIRDLGAPNGVIAHNRAGKFDLAALHAKAKAWPGLEGMDLAAEVSCRQTYGWDETRWQLGKGYGRQENPKFHVVAIDYGIKRNILRCLADAGCKVTVVPGNATAEDVLRHKPDGVFLSNGPGDPAATGVYAVPTIKALVDSGKLEITSQNHGFCVIEDRLPKNVVRTHVSLFDGSNEGIKLTDKPVFSVQYHPEASPGPQDSHYLFERFAKLMEQKRG